MNRQEAFNKVYLGLKGQNFKRSHDGSYCKYRGPHGLKCAVGHLIPDDKYSEHMESASMGFILEAIGIPADDYTFYDSLQSCHDMSKPGEMDGRLKLFAREWNLIVPDVEV